MAKRKLAIPNEFIKKVFEDFPRAEGFEIIPFKSGTV
jgi:hypothetical protein